MAISKPAKSKNSLKNSQVDAKPSFKETTKKEDILTDNKEVSFPVNIRVDNHIRNKVSALINLGVAKNAKAVVEHMIESEIAELSESEKTRFDRMYNILEQKDYMAKSLK